MAVLTKNDIKHIVSGDFKLSPIGQFTYLRTYSRKIHEEGRRERWDETVLRFVNYSMGLYLKHMEKIGIEPTADIKQEALQLFENIYTTKQFPSGRSLWVGGTEISELYHLSNFNCSFSHIKSFNDLCDVFYVLLLGTGVGCKHILGEDSIELMRNDIQITHKEYEPRPRSEREEYTWTHVNGNSVRIHVGDSKESWVSALRSFMDIHSNEEYSSVREIVMEYDSIRPRGEELKRFGGTASGHESIKAMFENISKVFRNEIDPTLAPLEVIDGKVKLRPIHILDICNFIGHNVVVGGRQMLCLRRK